MRFTLDGREHDGRLPASSGSGMSFRGLLTIVLPSETLAGVESTAPGQRSSRVPRVESFATFIAEASRRFAVPAHWIRSVMQLESGGDEQTISPPHDNILAGAAYLREMHDRFGSPGFLAAYNAGPERYEQHLATGRPLPAETQAYVAALAPVLDLEPRDGGASVASHVVPWRQSPLFVGRLESSPVDRRSAATLLLNSSSGAISPSALAPQARGLFVRRSNEVQSP